LKQAEEKGPTSLFDSTGKYVDDIYYEEGILVVDKLFLIPVSRRRNLISFVLTKTTTTEKKQNTMILYLRN